MIDFDDVFKIMDDKGDKVSLSDLIRLLNDDTKKVDIKVVQSPSDYYHTFGIKLLNMIFDHFPDKFQMDYLRLFLVVMNSMMSLLNVQIENDPRYPRKLTVSERVEICSKMQDYFGHLLAKKGIGRPLVEGEEKEK